MKCNLCGTDLTQAQKVLGITDSELRFLHGAAHIRKGMEAIVTYLEKQTNPPEIEKAIREFKQIQIASILQ